LAALHFINLNERTRALMLEELEYDQARHQLHISPYLSGQGIHDYSELLREAIEHGNDETLAASLSQHRRIARTAHRRNPEGGYSIVTVPNNAAEMLAQDAFNRYYIRAVCRRAIEEGHNQVVVYRARSVDRPRPTSEALIETTVDPAALLEDLRTHPDQEPALGIPAGPNSGLSVHLPL
jgi:hypothetical protein